VAERKPQFVFIGNWDRALLYFVHKNFILGAIGNWELYFKVGIGNKRKKTPTIFDAKVFLANFCFKGIFQTNDKNYKSQNYCRNITDIAHTLFSNVCVLLTTTWAVAVAREVKFGRVHVTVSVSQLPSPKFKASCLFALPFTEKIRRIKAET
jgi:hypothetical protein